MYAIIETGGKQYKVSKDSVVDIEKCDGKKGAELLFEKVLFVASGDTISVGAPYVKNAKVIAECVRGLKGKKVISFKYRKRKSSKTTKGHRQQLTRIRVKEISL